MNTAPPRHPAVPAVAWIVIAAGVSAAMHVGKLPPAVTVLRAELGLTLVQAGWVLSAIQSAGMVLGLAIGLAADRLGLRRCLLGGLLSMAGASALGALADGFGALLASRALEGLGFLCVAMPAPALIRRLVTPAQLSVAMGWWSTYMPMGMAVALIASPWLLQWQSWRTLWLVLAAISVLAALAVWRSVAPDAPHGAHAQAGAAGDWAARLKDTLARGGPWLVALSFMTYVCQWMGVVGFLPTIYQQAGLDARVAGLLTAVVAGMNIVGNVAAGRLLGSGWPPRRSLQLGFAVMALCALLAFGQWQGQSLPLWLRFGAIVMFSGVGGLVPGSLFICAVRLSSSAQAVSTTIGLVQQCNSVGQLIGPPLVAGIATWMGGWQWTWAITASLCAIGWWLALGVQRQVDRSPVPTV